MGSCFPQQAVGAAGAANVSRSSAGQQGLGVQLGAKSAGVAAGTECPDGLRSPQGHMLGKCAGEVIGKAGGSKAAAGAAEMLSGFMSGQGDDQLPIPPAAPEAFSAAPGEVAAGEGMCEISPVMGGRGCAGAVSSELVPGRAQEQFRQQWLLQTQTAASADTAACGLAVPGAHKNSGADIGSMAGAFLYVGAFLSEVTAKGSGGQAEAQVGIDRPSAGCIAMKLVLLLLLRLLVDILLLGLHLLA